MEATKLGVAALVLLAILIVAYVAYKKRCATDLDCKFGLTCQKGWCSSSDSALPPPEHFWMGKALPAWYPTISVPPHSCTGPPAPIPEYMTSRPASDKMAADETVAYTPGAEIRHLGDEIWHLVDRTKSDDDSPHHPLMIGAAPPPGGFIR